MNRNRNFVLAVANQKGGVGKTTTTVNLAQALTLCFEAERQAEPQGELQDQQRLLVIDLDPQGNTTQASGISLDTVDGSVADLIRNRSFPDDSAIYEGQFIDLIPATPLLAQVEREMVGMTNSELRLAQRLRGLKSQYPVILIDTPPARGPLMNSALNAADGVIIPVDSGVFAVHGIKSLLGEIEEIRAGFNPDLRVLGFLLTLCDPTRITQDVVDSMVDNFGDQVFQTRIRRSVKLREAPALGRTIFHHAPTSSGAEDYMNLAREVLERLCPTVVETTVVVTTEVADVVVEEVSHV